jgi:hypothetical protein
MIRQPRVWAWVLLCTSACLFAIWALWPDTPPPTDASREAEYSAHPWAGPSPSHGPRATQPAVSVDETPVLWPASRPTQPSSATRGPTRALESAADPLPVESGGGPSLQAGQWETFQWQAPAAAPVSPPVASDRQATMTDIAEGATETAEDAAEAAEAPTEAAEPPIETSEGAPPATTATAGWPEPTSLLERLEELASKPTTAPWATATIEQVRAFGPAALQRSDELDSILQRLEQSAAEVAPLAVTLQSERLACKLRRAGHALQRRIDVWQQLVEIGDKVPPGGDAAVLLEQLERYEHGGMAGDGRQLAQVWRELSQSSDEDLRRLADQLDAYYRNANVRVAVSAELLNRLMPEQKPEYGPVRETVLGTPVFGRSLRAAEASVRLLPDQNQARLALEVTGEVDSSTHSTSGPATFFNRSRSEYVARKPLRLDLGGIHTSPAKVEVQHATRLRSIRTDFDGIPFLGPLVKTMAHSQYEQQRPAANAEVRWKLASRALRQVDSEADARFDKASEQLQEEVLRPLDNLSLEPVIISSQTTEREVLMRLRLAGEDQLGGHTPRPRGPADCLASLQIHETAINNVLQRLELDGQTFTLPALMRHLAARLNQPEPWDIDPEEAEVTVTFAQQDAANVRFQDGQVELILSFATLRKPPQQWTEFQAHVFFRPQVDGLLAELVRNGAVHLTGSQFRTSSRMTLHGIFSRVFPKQRPIRLTPYWLLEEPKLADLGITQVVIDDGWIGAALGRSRVVQRAAGPKL